MAVMSAATEMTSAAMLMIQTIASTALSSRL